jgi:hypothetical protein
MSNKVVLTIFGIMVVCALFSVLCRTMVTHMEDRCVKAGVAEYYLDENRVRQFRFIVQEQKTAEEEWDRTRAYFGYVNNWVVNHQDYDIVVPLLLKAENIINSNTMSLVEKRLKLEGIIDDLWPYINKRK